MSISQDNKRPLTKENFCLHPFSTFFQSTLKLPPPPLSTDTVKMKHFLFTFIHYHRRNFPEVKPLCTLKVSLASLSQQRNDMKCFNVVFT